MALPSVISRKSFIETPKKTFTSDFRETNKQTAFDVLFERGRMTSTTPGWQDPDGEKTIPHPDKSFDLYQEIYQKIPVAKISIDHTANFAIQSGFELEGDAGAVKAIEEWMEKVNFNILLLDALKQMQIYGNAFLEITDIENPKFLPNSQLFVVVNRGGDKDGKVLRYAQKTNMQDPITFEPEELVHFKWNVESGMAESGFYGFSDLKAATATLKRMLNFQIDIGDVIHRHAEPIIHWTIGTEESPGTAAQVSNFKSTLGSREKGGDLITSWGVEGKTIATDMKMIQPDNILKHLENQLIAAMQVPEIFIRGGETSNKATADVELQAFDRRVKAIRSIASMFIEDFIFPKISEGKVKLMWNEPSFETEAKKAEMLANMTKAGMPLEVGMKIAGWAAFLNDLEEAGGQVMPMSPFDDKEEDEEGPKKPGEKEPEPKPKEKPKEEDYPLQADYYDALERWSRYI